MKADLNEYITSVKLAIKDFINPLHHYDLNCNIPGNNANVEKVKVHFLTHIPEDIRQYGTVLHYETEKGEHFNKHINENITYTNKLNPSRDVGLKFAKQSMMRHVLEGGSWLNKDGIREKTTEDVMSLFKLTSQCLPQSFGWLKGIYRQ